MTTKLLLVPILLLIACVFAGGFGALHNQISYSVSSEYFTEFKFHQFRVSETIPERLGASIVGWHASWWMGIVIGVILIPVGLVIRGASDYFWGMIRVFLVVTVTTLVVGLGALMLSFLLIDSDSVGETNRYGNEISDVVAFHRAGTMHNFSYLGGMAGIITGLLSIYWACRRQTELRRKEDEDGEARSLTERSIG